MIFALAGLGDTYKLASFSQQPGVNMSMVNAMSPSSQEATQEAGFPWALAGLVALGVGIAYASYVSDPHRDGSYEPNRSRHARRRVAWWSKGRVHAGVSKFKPKSGFVKDAKAKFKKAGAVKVEVNRRGSFCAVVGWVPRSKVKSLRSSFRRSGKPGHRPTFAVHT